MSVSLCLCVFLRHKQWVCISVSQLGCQSDAQGRQNAGADRLHVCLAAGNWSAAGMSRRESRTQSRMGSRSVVFRERNIDRRCGSQTPVYPATAGNLKELRIVVPILLCTRTSRSWEQESTAVLC